MNKVVLLMGGGDWFDASVSPLIAPEGHDPDADAKLWPGYRESGGKSLCEWLVADKGYREPTDAEVSIVWDY